MGFLSRVSGQATTSERPWTAGNGFTKPFVQAVQGVQGVFELIEKYIIVLRQVALTVDE
jgi:hypothetical protein